MEEKRWLCFFHPIHILRYSEEENGGDCNSFMAPNHDNDSEYVFSNVPAMDKIFSLSLLIP